MSRPVLTAQAMSSSSTAKDHCTASAWTIFWVDGVKLDHPVRGIGFACANFKDAPIDAGDVQAWAKKEALRKARAREARRIIYVANRFRRGRLLVTHDEAHEYFRFHQSEFWRRKRPLMSPEGREQKGINQNQLDLIVQAKNDELGPIPSLKDWVMQRRAAKTVGAI